MSRTIIKMNIIIPLIVFFLNTSPHLAADTADVDDSLTRIYLIQQSWHTGIVMKVQDIISDIPELGDFNKFKYVDIGWGDEDFYQHPGFDAGLAVKALFYSTSSAIRVEGFNFDIEKYIEMSDMAVTVALTREQLKSLSEYISASFSGRGDKPLLLSSRYLGNIRYYKAEGVYNLFNTCNTWIARGLTNAGIEIKDHIILAEQLFREAAKFGNVLKTREDHNTE